MFGILRSQSSWNIITSRAIVTYQDALPVARECGSKVCILYSKFLRAEFNIDIVFVSSTCR